MWSNQDGYDNLDHGGGFVNSQGTSQDDTSGNKRGYRSKTLVPCTIARLLAAQHQDDMFISNGTELTQVSIIAMVVRAEEAENFRLYTVSDMTAPCMEVREFIDEESFKGQSLHPVNTYLHILGNLRSFGKKRSITAFMTKPLQDLNQLTAHLLECMYAKVYRSRPQAQRSGNQPPPMISSNDQDLGLTKQQIDVLNCIKSCMDEPGLTIKSISETLTNIPMKQIVDAVDYLSNEGHVYSTVDDHHFKATDI